MSKKPVKTLSKSHYKAYKKALDRLETWAVMLAEHYTVREEK